MLKLDVTNKISALKKVGNNKNIHLIKHNVNKELGRLQNNLVTFQLAATDTIHVVVVGRIRNFFYQKRELKGKNKKLTF